MHATLKSIMVAGLLGATVVGSASALPLVAGGLGTTQDVTAPKVEAARLVCNYRGRCYRRYGYGYRGYNNGYGYRPYYGPRVGVGVGGLGFGFY